MLEAYGHRIPRTLADATADRRRLALIVYDMQAGIVPQIPGGAQIVERVRGLVDAARAAGVLVVFTRHLSLPVSASGVATLRSAFAWQKAERVEDLRAPFLESAPASQIVPELEPRPDEPVFTKLAMSAFVGTPLDFALRDRDINCYAIAGIALEVGIEPTVRHSTDLGYLPVVIADACGHRDDAARVRALEGFAFAGGIVTTDSAAFCAAIG